MSRAARRSRARLPASRLPVLQAPPAEAWQAWLQLGSAAASTWLAAAQVIALRMPLLATAMLSPDGHRNPEVRRMVAEKPAAFARSWQILAWRMAVSPMHAPAAALVPLRQAAEANLRRLRR